MIKKILSGCLFVALLSCSSSGFSKNSDRELLQAQKIWKSISIQHQGRIKPFDTFSREVLKTVYGRESYKKRSAVEVILSWLIIPDFWEEMELFLVEKEIKQSLGLPLRSKHFRPSELRGNQKLALQLAELTNLRQRGERLDSYFQNLEKLETRWILYEAVRTGFLIRLEPQPNKGTWRSLPEMTDVVEKQFTLALSKYVQLISKNVDSSLNDGNSKKRAEKEQNRDPLPDKKSPAAGEDVSDRSSELDGSLLVSFKKDMEEFQKLAFKNIPKPSKISSEVFYNRFQPFQKAWIFYFLFLLAGLLLSVFRRTDLWKWLFPLPAAGWVCHSLGMILRSYIMSRPPVSNMYETVTWVPWVAVIAGFVFYLRGYKGPFSASVIMAFFCLLLTSLAPEILDGSLQPLEAVLRSSFWLSTHVLVITMSYSFFFLAFVLGDMALISYLTNKKDPLSSVKKLYNPIYRSIQWGVVFLAGGTILGGIWADYSWGRFWGWDPKESWALVSLLAYLVLLHGKLAGWVKVFGMAVGSVMMFFSVIMAWYGVNFILGAGLHSYGFGSGGVEYVAGFLVLHVLLCGGAFFKKIQLEKN